MNMTTSPKNVLITGCSSGFGLAMVHSFLNDGWHVIATARHPETSQALLQIQNPLLTRLKLDITVADHRLKIQSFIADTLHNQLDCLINNAGFGLLGVFEECNEAQIREQLETNIIGLILLTQVCLPALRRSKGRIINMSSALGYFAIPMYTLYTTSKFALEGFSESLYHELAPHGVQIAIIEPGVIKTHFAVNIKRPAYTIDDPIYMQQKESFKKIYNVFYNLPQNTSAEFIAKVALKLANQKKMPLRIRITFDAKLMYWLRRLLPSRVFLYLVAQYYKILSK